MEQVLQLLDTAWRVLLAGMFAMAPGGLVWLVVLGTFLLFRKLSRSDFTTRLLRGGRPT